MCEAMLALHVLTGCDSTSCFKGIGKIKPLKLLLKSPTHCESIRHLGDEWDIDENLVNACEEFVCAIYGKAKYKKVDEARYVMLKAKCDGELTAKNLTSSTIDLSKFPPSRECLKEHIARANYQTKIWKDGNVAISELPKPWDGHGWLENGEPLWCKLDKVLPKALIDILHTDDSDNENDSDDDEFPDFQYSVNSDSEDDTDEE